MKDHPSHKTRMSDSSMYDEICTLCGATDGRGDDRLTRPCPKAEEQMNRIVVHAVIEKCQEKFTYTDWEKTPDGPTNKRQSLGWYVQFVGSSESIHLFDTDPGWKSGDKVTITFERMPS